MSIVIPSRNFIFGLAEKKPLRTTLPGVAKIRLRPDDFATVAIHHEGVTRFFVVEDCGDHWQPALELEQGRNIRA